MANLPIHAPCQNCERGKCYPFYAAGRMLPWMTYSQLHFYCKRCLARLMKNKDHLRALYDAWVRRSEDDGGRRPFLDRISSVEKFSRWDIFERDGWICQLCHEPIDAALDGRKPFGPTLDHIIPVSRGGTHTQDNVQLAHRRCNSQKGNRVAPASESS